MFNMPRRDHHNTGSPSESHPPPSADTRQKLLEAAAQVFAECGFYSATIREICRRAGANVAAVNYTFGDKVGLYTEVLRQSMRAPETAQLITALDAAASPEELIRTLIHLRLLHLCGRKKPDQAFRIMMHEFSQPTPAMARVIDEGMRPISRRLLQAVGELLGLPPDHEKTRLCSNSIIGQVLFYAFSQPVLSRLQPELKLTPEQLERIAAHIADFSLAYLKHAAAKQNGALQIDIPPQTGTLVPQNRRTRQRARLREHTQ